MTSVTVLIGASLTAALLGGCAALQPRQADTAPDPYVWLEEVASERALAWVRERNAATETLLTAHPQFGTLKAQLRSSLDARGRIPAIRRIGPHVYNHWTDAAHPRGVLRRTTLAEYGSAEPAWESVLDLDALARAENENWVYGGMQCVSAKTEEAVDRCMLGLSRGGADAKVWREFDLARKQFVPGGFALPEAKSMVGWVDRDTLYVGTDFGPGTLTASGYARIIKRWQRGTPLAAALPVFEGQAADVAVEFYVDPTPGFERHMFFRAKDFHHSEKWLLHDGRLLRLDVPDDASTYLHRQSVVLVLRSAYRGHPAGAVLATTMNALLKGEPRYERLFEPTGTRSLARGGIRFTRTRMLLNMNDNVASRLEELWHDGSAWHRRLIATPPAARASATPQADPALIEDPLGETYLLSYEDFLTPNSLFLARTGSDERKLLRQGPKFFDGQGMRVEQRFAISRDGTRVPYFIVWPQGARPDASNPTLLYGYGGFQVSMLPAYQAQRGAAWLAQGGVYVLANIRGGGEFGPDWHRSAIKANKQRSYDDFIAVAEDLIAQRVTSPAHLGVIGGSNGGLLVGAVVTQRPELFGAAVATVPLLDMRRYTKLLAGASWIAEYGDPDQSQDWAYIGQYSPYHQVKRDARYPRMLLITSTRDDRVHPAHARKMAALLQAQGHPVLYYENVEGGHGAAADAGQKAHLQALEFSYLWLQLGRPSPAAAAVPTSPAARP